MARMSGTEKKLRELAPFIAPVTGDISTRAEQIPDKLVIRCDMPVGVYAQEAQNITNIAHLDRTELQKTYLDWNVVEELPRRIDYLRECESRWWKRRFWITPEQREYEAAKSRAECVFNELCAHVTYLSNYSDAMKAAPKIIGREGKDFSQALSDLHLVCETNWDAFEELGCTRAMFEQLEHFRDTYPWMEASHRSYELSKSSVECRRNKAYTLVRVALEELRQCAAHAFRRDRRRLKPYLSEYYRKRPPGE